MAGHSGRVRMLLRALAMAVPGAFVGLVVGCVTNVPTWPPATAPIKEYPLPHHIPKYPDGVSLRFAMVHDVLHERYARHGKEYYQERNRRVRRELETLKPQPTVEAESTERYFSLLDDLGAGLDHLGEPDEVVRVLRDKLKQQQTRGYHGRALYTTYANLGTFLIHGSFRQACGGNAEAKDRLAEGLGFIHKSIEVNPGAHFGRESWQAVAVEFLTAALDKPQMLLKYDMVGNRLDVEIDPSDKRCFDVFAWSAFRLDRDAAVYLDNPQAARDRPEHFRQHITTVGAEEGWSETVQTSHHQPVPFDEPALGFIGMWRVGGGPSPHFALALG